MAGAVGKRRRRRDHAIAVRAQPRQAAHHLTRKTLDSADLGANRRPCIDRDLRYWTPAFARAHYTGRTARRSTSPTPSRPTPTAAQAHRFSPVYGSVPLEACAALPEDVVDDPALVVELPEACDELEELPAELAALGVVAVVVADRVVVFVSGSTYCWSPADVLVPAASAVAVTSSASSASAAEQARILSRRRTVDVFKQRSYSDSATQVAGAQRRALPGEQW
jgi:hypothetical protein